MGSLLQHPARAGRDGYEEHNRPGIPGIPAASPPPAPPQARPEARQTQETTNELHMMSPEPQDELCIVSPDSKIHVKQTMQDVDAGDYKVVIKDLRDEAGNKGPGGDDGVIDDWIIRLK